MLGGVSETVPGYCCNCHKPLGLVAWDAADFVFCKPCAKAMEVYTPPPGSLAKRLRETGSRGVAAFSFGGRLT